MLRNNVELEDVLRERARTPFIESEYFLCLERTATSAFS